MISINIQSVDIIANYPSSKPNLMEQLHRRLVLYQIPVFCNYTQGYLKFTIHQRLKFQLIADHVPKACREFTRKVYDVKFASLCLVGKSEPN